MLTTYAEWSLVGSPPLIDILLLPDLRAWSWVSFSVCQGDRV